MDNAGRAGDTSPALGALAEVVGYHIAQASVSTSAMFERHVGTPFNLRKVEFSILMLLLANGALASKQLARSLMLSAPNLTMLLDRLQERALLRRERSTTDRRSQNIVLTDEGRRTARAAAAAAGPMEAELHGRLSAAERAMLIELLRKAAGR